MFEFARKVSVVEPLNSRSWMPAGRYSAPLPIPIQCKTEEDALGIFNVCAPFFSHCTANDLDDSAVHDIICNLFRSSSLTTATKHQFKFYSVAQGYQQGIFAEW